MHGPHLKAKFWNADAAKQGDSRVASLFHDRVGHDAGDYDIHANFNMHCKLCASNRDKVQRAWMLGSHKLCRSHVRERSPSKVCQT